MTQPEMITCVPADELGPFLRFCLSIPNEVLTEEDLQQVELIKLMVAALETDVTERWPHLVAEITGLSDLRYPPVALLYAQFSLQARIAQRKAEVAQ